MTAAVLVVDDDEKSRRLACDVLVHAGYEVARAASGEQGLELARRTRYDVVLLDIQLPGASGVETFKAMRALPGWNGAPVIAMTASVMPDERSSLIKEGFDAFVPKPLRFKDMLRLVAEVLARPP